MVVEDDDEIREAIVSSLEDEGLTVYSAINGKEALALLRRRTDVRAIVLDLVMPVMNGATFRGEQLADPTIAHIPIILLTGRDDFVPLANAMNASAYLQKPITADALLEALRPLLVPAVSSVSAQAIRS
jgi:CheY-like chemotaxis protein